MFLWLAFGSLDFLAGQVVGKAWMVLLSIPFIALLRRRDERLGIVAGLTHCLATRQSCARRYAKRAAKLRFAMSSGRSDDTLPQADHHRDHHHHAAEERHPPLLDERAEAAGAGGPRLVGPAFTLRFVPAREDLATPESWAKPISTRGAIEAMPEGCIAVADAMGVTTAGIFGDILTMRMMKRGVTALVTDGVDARQGRRAASKLPVWCAGAAAPASVNGLTFVGWQEPIGCGGCAVFPATSSSATTTARW